MPRGMKATPVPTNAVDAVKFYKYDTNWEMKCHVPDRAAFICCDVDDRERDKVLEANRPCLTCVTRKPDTSVVADHPRNYFPVIDPNAQGDYCCFLLAAYAPIPDDMRAPADMGDADAELYDLMVRCFIAFRLMEGAIATAKASDDVAYKSKEHWAEQARSIIIVPLTYVSFQDFNTPFFNVGLALGGFLHKVFQDKEELPISFHEIYDQIVEAADFYKKIGMGTATPGPTICGRCKYRKDRRYKTRPCLRYTGEPFCLACRGHRRMKVRCFAISSSGLSAGKNTSANSSRKRKLSYTAIKSQHLYSKRKKLLDRVASTEASSDMVEQGSNAIEDVDSAENEVDELCDDDDEYDELYDEEGDEYDDMDADVDYELSTAETQSRDDDSSASIDVDTDFDKPDTLDSVSASSHTQNLRDMEDDDDAFDANKILRHLTRRDELIVNELSKLHRTVRCYAKKQQRLSRELHRMKVDRDRMVNRDVARVVLSPELGPEATSTVVVEQRALSPELGPADSDGEVEAVPNKPSGAVDHEYSDD